MASAHVLAKCSLGAAWLGAVVFGFSMLHGFEARPGPPPSPPQQWPADAGLPLDGERPTLLLFAHPQCPCTSATIEELNRLLAQCADRVHAVVLFTSDPALGPDWTHSASWSAAQELPGVTVREDPRGETARRFGAKTSGQALLYTVDGRLAFEGGITSARGQVGDNAGSAALQSLLLAGGHGSAGRRDPAATPDERDAPGIAHCTPVYGCALVTPRESSP